jgi:hypothetical protein
MISILARVLQAMAVGPIMFFLMSHSLKILYALALSSDCPVGVVGAVATLLF